MSPRVEGNAHVAITATRALPVPTEPVGYAKRTPVRSGHVPIKCGTPRGYDRHRELGGIPCKDCLAAVKAKPLTQPKPKRVTREWDIDEAKRIYLSGTSLAATAAHFGISRDIVRAGLADAGVEIRAKGGGWNKKPKAPKKPRERKKSPAPFDVEKGRELYESGLSYLAVAKALNVRTEKTVRVHLTRAGVKPRTRSETNQGRRGPRIVLPVEKIVDEYGAGDSLPVLAERYGVTQKTISDRLKGAGVQLRVGGRGRRAPNALPDEKVAEVLRMIEAGVSVRRTARETGVAESTIGGILKRRAA